MAGVVFLFTVTGLMHIVADIFKNSFFYGFIFLGALVLFSGCSEPEKADKAEFLLKTPAMGVTGFEFSEELDLKRAAYPYNIDEEPAEYNEMVIHLVKILSEELILLTAAADKGVVVTDEELALAEDEFKKDYPEDSFDQMLLTNAIPYRLWKKRFKRDLIIEKLIHQELVEKIEITPQDIVSFYDELKSEARTKKVDDSSDDAFTETKQNLYSETQLVSRLRMQKTQEKYDAWIQDLQNLYPLEINEEALKKFLIELENNKGR
ncbi:MAG: hypothetical protein KKE62_05565 [Proteobacteria bacterium]|nr:hypothetical protein [Pseudomonadota bacterium]MBU1387024.1 hypothetical protein [Pseudomonadota bacterium]MBU1542295.1 hypothetical protein [Pseudomonadota bacterium]MBU2481090.1 hypothetical protein [Pseudomonadota bacterium]